MPITKVDGYYFHPTQKVRILAQRQGDLSKTPWTPLEKPLSECKVTPISTAGIFLKGDVSFDYERERREPTWGDPAHREIPRTAGQSDVEYSHPNIDMRYLAKDRNVAWPVDIFLDYEKEGVIGSLADTLYSIMGYILNFNPLVKKTAPLMVEKMKAEEVDADFIIPV